MRKTHFEQIPVKEALKSVKEDKKKEEAKVPGITRGRARKIVSVRGAKRP
jgi:hypothetical protein